MYYSLSWLPFSYELFIYKVWLSNYGLNSIVHSFRSPQFIWRQYFWCENEGIDLLCVHEGACNWPYDALAWVTYSHRDWWTTWTLSLGWSINLMPEVICLILCQLLLYHVMRTLWLVKFTFLSSSFCWPAAIDDLYVYRKAPLLQSTCISPLVYPVQLPIPHGRVSATCSSPLIKTVEMVWFLVITFWTWSGIEFPTVILWQNSLSKACIGAHHSLLWGASICLLLPHRPLVARNES